MDKYKRYSLIHFSIWIEKLLIGVHWIYILMLNMNEMFAKLQID